MEEGISTCNCIIETLRRKLLIYRCLRVQKALVNGEIPRPDFKIIDRKQPENKNVSLVGLYKNTPWLCGCSYLSKLFCWPCLIFSIAMNDWSKYGFSNIGSFDAMRKIHENSTNHIISVTEFDKLLIDKDQGTSKDLNSQNTVENIENDSGNSVINSSEHPYIFDQASNNNIEIKQEFSDDKNFDDLEISFVDIETNKAEFGGKLISQEPSREYQDINMDCSEIQSNFNTNTENKNFEQSNMKQELSDNMDIVMEFDNFVEKKFNINSENVQDVTMDIASLPKASLSNDSNSVFKKQEDSNRHVQNSGLNCKCIIETIINNNFHTMPLKQKECIIYSKMPKPKLSEIFPNCEESIKKNQYLKIYKQTAWICGCKKLMKLYCWPCILFSNCYRVWNRHGYCNLDRLKNSQVNHEYTKMHIRSQKMLESFMMKRSIENKDDLKSTNLKNNPISNGLVLENQLETQRNTLDSSLTTVIKERRDSKKELNTDIHSLPVTKTQKHGDQDQVESLPNKPTQELQTRKFHHYTIDMIKEHRRRGLSTKDKEKYVASNVPRRCYNVEIKENGGNCFVKRYYSHLYTKFKWLCNCLRNNTYFCWPCLIFSTSTNAWNTNGHSNLNNLKEMGQRHELTRDHIYSQILFKRCQDRLANVTVDVTPNILHQKHNKTTMYLITKMIDAIFFLTNKETQSNLADLLFFMSESDVELKHFIDTSKITKDFLNTIQEDLINAVTKVLIEEIKHEIMESRFVSIVVTESLDHKGYVSLHIRYLNKSFEVQERLVGYENLNSDDNLLKYIEEKILELNCCDKLIAQAHNRAIFAKKIHEDIQKIYPLATLTYHYNFSIDSIISKAILSLEGFNHFFQTLKMVCKFFCDSPKRTSYLNSKIHMRIPSVDQIQLQYSSKIFSVIEEYKLDILMVLEEILENKEEWDTDSVFNASGLQPLLKELQFDFNIKLFVNVFNGLTILNLSEHSLNLFDLFVSEEIQKFLFYLNYLKSQFDNLWKCLIYKGCDFNNDTIRRKLNLNQLRVFYYERYTYTLIEMIKTINIYFLEFNKIQFVTLFDMKPTIKQNMTLLDELLRKLNDVYPNIFNLPKLSAEFQCIYKYEVFKELSSVVEIFKKMLDIKEIVSETWKLAELIYTMPIIRPNTKEHSSFAYKEKNSSLRILSSERSLLENLKGTKEFYNKVIEEFSIKERDIDLTFR